MRYSTKLRHELAWLEDHPEFDEKLSDNRYEYPTVSIWLADDDTSEFSRLCKAMGSFEKSGHYGTLTAMVRPEADGEIIFAVRVSIDGQCEKRPKVDENGFPVTRKTTKTVTVTEPVTEVQEVEEPEYEWKCPDSFLSL